MKRLLAIILCAVMIFTIVPAIPANQADAASSGIQYVDIKVTRNYDYAYKVLEIVNKERKAAGVAPLVMDASLLEAAMLRSGECCLLWSHTRPDGSSCFTINKSIYGENIASGLSSPSEIVKMWMGSASHKSNILSKNFTTIGIGCAKNAGGYQWVQCFGTGKTSSSCAKPASKETVIQTVALKTGKVTEDGNGKSIKFKAEIQFDSGASYNPAYTGETSKAAVYMSCYRGYAKLENTGISWSSSNPEVASIDANGKIIANKPGHTYITAVMDHYTVKEKFAVTCKTHNYLKTTVKATPTSNGSIETKCTVCGQVDGTASKKLYRPEVKLSKTKLTYNGKVRKPKVTVQNSQGKTIKSSNYTVTYQEGRKKPGAYKVTVVFKGSRYEGTIAKKFKILPAETSVTKLTGKKKAITVKWKKQSRQTTGYEVRYSTNSSMKNAKLVTVTKTSSTGKTIKKLKPKKTYYVQVRTYKNVDGKNYCSSWSSKKSVKTK